MQTHGKNVERFHRGHMLEHGCFQWFLLFGQRIYNHNRYNFGHCTNFCILEITNAIFDQTERLHYDGIDTAFHDRHDC